MFSQLNRELHAALRRQDIEEMRRCLDDGADPNQRHDRGWGPLNFAMTCKHPFHAAKLLLSRGALVDQTDSRQLLSPFHSACLGGDIEAAKFLLDNGARIDRRVGEGLDSAPPRYGGIGVSHEVHGMTALGLASRNDRARMATLLLNRGVDVDLGWHRGPSALCIALEYTRDLQMVNVLLERGAVIDIGPEVCHAIQRNENMIGRGGAASTTLALLVSVLTQHYSGGPVLTVGGGESDDDDPGKFWTTGRKAWLDVERIWSRRRRHLLAPRMLRIRLHVVGPRAEHAGSARHRVFDCRLIARNLVEFLSGPLLPQAPPAYCFREPRAPHPDPRLEEYLAAHHDPRVKARREDNEQDERDMEEGRLPARLLSIWTDDGVEVPPQILRNLPM